MPGLVAYHDSSLTTRVATQVGRLDGDGSTTSFQVSEEPQEVRLYNNDKPYGEVLTGWTYDSTSKTVTLSSAPASGDIVIAFVGTFLFYDQRSIVTSSNDADRTLEQPIYLYADGINTESITVNIEDLLPSVGAKTIWFKLALDNNGSPGTYQDPPLTVPNISNGSTSIIWVRAIEEHNPNKQYPETYRDVYLVIEYLAVSSQ